MQKIHIQIASKTNESVSYSKNNKIYFPIFFTCDEDLPIGSLVLKKKYIDPFIAIDDGLEDKTANSVRFTNTTVIKPEINRSKEQALMRGFKPLNQTKCTVTDTSDGCGQRTSYDKDWTFYEEPELPESTYRLNVDFIMPAKQPGIILAGAEKPLLREITDVSFGKAIVIIINDEDLGCRFFEEVEYLFEIIITGSTAAEPDTMYSKTILHFEEVKCESDILVRI